MASGLGKLAQPVKAIKKNAAKTVEIEILFIPISLFIENNITHMPPREK
jgi:hypothetical protein